MELTVFLKIVNISIIGWFVYQSIEYIYAGTVSEIVVAIDSFGFLCKDLHYISR